jgi:hypothetical protein
MYGGTGYRLNRRGLKKLLIRTQLFSCCHKPTVISLLDAQHVEKLLLRTKASVNPASVDS